MMRRALCCGVLLCAALALVAADDPVGICGLDGFDLNDLYFGQFWNFTVENPQENCLHDNETEVASCTVFFSVCKPLPTSVCGGISDVSYCQVVTATNGTEKYYNIGSYTSKHNYIALTSGFSAVRYGQLYPDEHECGDHMFVSTVNFECDSSAKYSVNQPNISQYVTSFQRIPSAECYMVMSLKYSGACYEQPTLAPSHCSLTGFDTTAISKRDYFIASVPTSACYNISDTCTLVFAFCHPLPLDISNNCRNPESAICQTDKLEAATHSLSMGAFENYTRFYENVDTDQVGFHVLYNGGSNPGVPNCTAGLQTRVIFVCNKDAKWQNEDVTFYTEVEKETCFYNIIMQYDGACYKAHPINGATSTEKTSFIGWIFIGIFLFAVLSYLAIGSAVQFFVRGERGLRVLPNFDLWKTFVLLVFEGGKFSLDTITCHRFDGVPRTRQGKVDYDHL